MQGNRMSKLKNNVCRVFKRLEKQSITPGGRRLQTWFLIRLKAKSLTNWTRPESALDSMIQRATATGSGGQKKKLIEKNYRVFQDPLGITPHLFIFYLWGIVCSFVVLMSLVGVVEDSSSEPDVVELVGVSGFKRRKT